jgi:hypothetical protein
MPSFPSCTEEKLPCILGVNPVVSVGVCPMINATFTPSTSSQPAAPSMPNVSAAPASAANPTPGVPLKPKGGLNIKYLLASLVLILVLVGVVAAVYLSSISQDVRQQAAVNPGYNACVSACRGDSACMSSCSPTIPDSNTGGNNPTPTPNTPGGCGGGEGLSSKPCLSAGNFGGGGGIPSCNTTLGYKLEDIPADAGGGKRCVLDPQFGTGFKDCPTGTYKTPTGSCVADPCYSLKSVGQAIYDQCSVKERLTASPERSDKVTDCLKNPGATIDTCAANNRPPGMSPVEDPFSVEHGIAVGVFNCLNSTVRTTQDCVNEYDDLNGFELAQELCDSGGCIGYTNIFTTSAKNKVKQLATSGTGTGGTGTGTGSSIQCITSNQVPPNQTQKAGLNICYGKCNGSGVCGAQPSHLSTRRSRPNCSTIS